MAGNESPKPLLDNAPTRGAMPPNAMAGPGRKMAELRIVLLDYEDIAVIELKRSIEDLLPDKTKANIITTIR